MTRGDTILAIVRGAIDGLLVAAVCLLLVGPVVARVLPMLGFETIVIVGSSMEPSIPLGSVVVETPISPDSIEAGQVVTIRIPDRGITYSHRVTEVVQRNDGPWLRTRGDNNAKADPVLVPASWVLGRVDVRLPGVGYLIRLLSVPSGIGAVLGCALTLYLAARLIEDVELARRRRLAPPAPSIAGAQPIRLIGPVPTADR